MTAHRETTAEAGGAAPAPGAHVGRPRRHAGALLIAAAILLGAGAYLAAARGASGEFGLPLDDAWIHARMARNLAGGGGFSFNPGERSATSSAPMWTLLLGVPAALGIPFPWAGYLLGIAASGALAWLVFLFVSRATGEPATAAVGAFLVAGTHPFPWSSVSGMEPGLAAALVIGIALLAREGRWGACMALSVPAALTRPELIALPGLVLIDALLRRPGTRRRPWLPALGAVAAMAAPLLVNWMLTGHAVAGSLAAKVGHHGAIAALLGGRAQAIPEVLASNLTMNALPFLRALARDNVLLLLAAPVGLLRLARGPAGSSMGIALILYQVLCVGVLAPFGGPEFHEQRYTAPLVAIVIVSGLVGLTRVPAWRTRRAWRWGVLLAVLLVSGAGAWGGLRRYALEVQNITGMQVTVARWLRGRLREPALVATNDIGAIGFFTDARVLDTTGLASPEAIEYIRRPVPRGGRVRGWNGANEAGLLDLLRLRRPEYVAIFPSWYPSPDFQEALGPVVYRADLEDNLICGDRTMLVFRPEWDAAAAGHAPHK